MQNDHDEYILSGVESEVDINSQTVGSDDYYDERKDPYIPSPRIKGGKSREMNDAGSPPSSHLQAAPQETSEAYDDQSVYSIDADRSTITDKFRKLNTSDDQYQDVNSNVDMTANYEIDSRSQGSKHSINDKSPHRQYSENDLDCSYQEQSARSDKSKAATVSVTGSSKSSQLSLIDRITKADGIPLVTKYASRNDLVQQEVSSENSKGSEGVYNNVKSNSSVTTSEGVNAMKKAHSGELYKSGSDLALSMNRYGSMQSIPENQQFATSEMAYQQSESRYQQSEGYSTEYHPHFKDSMISGSVTGDQYSKDKPTSSKFKGSYFSLANSSDFLTAVEKGDSTFVRKALENPNIDPNRKTKYQSKTAIHLAAGYGQLKVTEDLLYAGIDPACKSVDNRTPLHEAAQGGHDRVLQLLLDYTRNVDAQDKDGQSACHVAAYQGEVTCLEILVDKGGQLVLKDKEGRQPAHLAAMRNHRNILEYLYDKGIDLSCKDATGKLPLHYAAQYGSLDCLACLVERECDITLADDHGNLALHFAARNDHLDCLRFLIKQGSSMDVTQNQQRTAAHVAAANGSHKVLHYLCEKGCDVSAQDQNLNLPIHLAAHNGKAKCFNCLLNHDSDVTAVNDKNDTPLDSAKKMGHRLLVEKAMNNEVACPLCKQQYEYDEWQEVTAPTPVVRTVTSMAATAFSSPLPKQHTVKTPKEINAQRRDQILKNKKKRIKAAPAGDYAASTKNLFTFPLGGDTFSKKLPPRDLSAKYFGNYLPPI